MQVTALKVLETDRIDPWARPNSLRTGGRGCWQGPGHHNKVVADTMGPEVVMQHGKGPGDQTSDAHRFPCCLHARAVLREATERSKYNVPDDQGIFTVTDDHKSKYRVGRPGPVGLASMAQRSDSEGGDREDSEGDSEGDCELWQPAGETPHVHVLRSRRSESCRRPGESDGQEEEEERKAAGKLRAVKAEESDEVAI